MSPSSPKWFLHCIYSTIRVWGYEGMRVVILFLKNFRNWSNLSCCQLNGSTRLSHWGLIYIFLTSGVWLCHHDIFICIYMRMDKKYLMAMKPNLLIFCYDLCFLWLKYIYIPNSLRYYMIFCTWFWRNFLLFIYFVPLFVMLTLIYMNLFFKLLV